MQGTHTPRMGDVIAIVEKRVDKKASFEHAEKRYASFMKSKQHSTGHNKAR
jgi:hypothetical protein